MKSVNTAIIFGYSVGLLVTFIFTFSISIFNVYSINTARGIFLILIEFSILLTCYNRSIRCTIILGLSILCSSKGRSLVIAFAFFLAAIGPTINIVNNVDVLTRSLSCGQTQLKEAMENIIDLIKQPLISIKEAIGTAIMETRRVMDNVQVVLYRVQELVILLLSSIKNAFNWLENIVNICNDEFGTPFDRCMRIADNAISDCKAKLGPIKGICNITHLLSMLCYTVKIINVFCVMVDIFNEFVISNVIEHLKHFTTEVQQLFDVKIVFNHTFQFKTSASKDFQEIGSDILTEVHKQMKSLFLIFGWLGFIGTVLSVSIFFKAIYFKIKFISNIEYKNIYITQTFWDIDIRRKERKQTTILPLKNSERKKYVKLTGYQLTRSEFRKIARSMLFLIISCIQLFSICFTDYSLYYTLSTISHYGGKSSEIEVPSYLTIDVRGGGYIGDIFKGIVNAFEPFFQNYTLDTSHCLPNPRIPDFLYYVEIAFICSLAWVLLFCQPYGLRMRHIIMQLYYPNVAIKRAYWLYNQILMNRMTFMKFSRRRLRAKFKNNLYGRAPFLYCLRMESLEYCLLCSESLNDNKFVCKTVNCIGIYCENCFRQSNNKCCICSNPIDYGDFSDISEVKDSSDEFDDIQVNSH